MKNERKEVRIRRRDGLYFKYCDGNGPCWTDKKNAFIFLSRNSAKKEIERLKNLYTNLEGSALRLECNFVESEVSSGSDD